MQKTGKLKGESPIVSIIIATYNSGKTLKETLKSVQSQVFQDWECIIVDGDSNDNTISIIEEIEHNDSRFRHISEPDRGVYDAFNKGWKNARGEWIYYLGSSDKVLKNGLYDLIKIDHPDAAIVSGHVYGHKIDGTLKPGYSKGFRGGHQGKITRKSVIEKFGGFDERYKIVADEDLIRKIENSGLKIDNVNVFVAIFEVDGLSQSLSNAFVKYKELYNIFKKYPISIKYPLLKVIGFSLKSVGSIIYRKMRRFVMIS